MTRRLAPHAAPVARRTRAYVAVAIATALVLGLSFDGLAQRGAGPAPVATPRASAPVDLTGYWVSVVTQDWRWRMVTPAKGDYRGIPMNQAAKVVADAWDPARDEASGEACRSYGAPALMGVPGRLRITWQDDTTLKVETDAGQQTRLLRFGDGQPPASAPRTWQGVSAARWQTPRANPNLLLRPAARSAADAPAAGARNGSLRVVTTRLRPGYLRKNGVPYSAETVLTEHWAVLSHPGGERWLTITTDIADPVYLREPRLIGYQFRKEPDGARWDPTPCSAHW